MKSFAIVLLLGGVALRFGWLGVPAPNGAPRIEWLRDEHKAVQASLSSGKPLLIDFGAEWCAACKELDVHTWTDPKVASEVADHFVALKIDATDDTDEIEALEKKYAVPGLPTVLMMACKDPQPSECAVPQDGPGRVTGFLTPPEMLERMRTLE